MCIRDSSNSDPSLLTHPIPGNDDSTKSIRIIVDVILDAIQNGASRRVEAPTRRKDITPVAQEPDFLDQEDEPEVTLPEGYDENDFDERKKPAEDDTPEVEAKEEVSNEESTPVEGEKAADEENQEDSGSKEEDTSEDAPAEEAAKS